MRIMRQAILNFERAAVNTQSDAMAGENQRRARFGTFTPPRGRPLDPARHISQRAAQALAGLRVKRGGPSECELSNGNLRSITVGL